MSSVVRSRIRAFLEPGDALRYVFPAQLVQSATPYVMVVVSDRAVTVLSTGFLGRNRPKSVLATYPRNVRIGPVDTKLIPEFTLQGIRYEVDEEYVAVINAADAEFSADFMPPDPLPDL
jgi:hypothetical protein